MKTERPRKQRLLYNRIVRGAVRLELYLSRSVFVLRRSYIERNKKNGKITLLGPYSLFIFFYFRPP